ncbi:MAG: T9SS type A sorting domain-containing protein [Bacteroidetes bacterium]|nr:T9SS type A sorting domain-containing protein [Bacteroidota bacterium]
MRTIVSIVFLFVITLNLKAQVGTNFDFSAGNITGWTLEEGTNTNSGAMSTASGYSASTEYFVMTAGATELNGFPITMSSPLGGNYVRVGKTSAGATVCKLSRSFTVSASSPAISVAYALVLYDGAHNCDEQPYFYFALKDGYGNLIPGSTHYSSPYNSSCPLSDPLLTANYRDWSTLSFDLSGYIGSVVTVELYAAGCVPSGHAGYCYFDAQACSNSFSPNSLLANGISYPLLSSQNSLAICGSNTLNIIAPPGAGSYSWSGSGVNGATTQSVSITQAGVYHLYFDKASACSNTTAVTFSVGAMPSVSVTNSYSVCSGTNVVLHASGALNYSWYPLPAAFSSTASSSATFTPTTSTTFTVTGTASNGCWDTASVYIGVSPSPSLGVSGSTVICSGASATLVATGADTYTWVTSGTQTNSIVVSPTVTTTYALNGAITSSGCTQMKYITLGVQNPSVSISPANVNVCTGSSVTVNATGADTYTWSNGANGNSIQINPVTTTNYTVNATNACGVLSNTFVAHSIQTPTVSVTGPAFVCGSSLLTYNATGASTYQWSTSGASGVSSGSGPSYSINTPTATTQFTVNCTGTSNGCSSNKQYTVAVSPTPTISISGALVICPGATTTLTAGGADTYTWSTGATTSSVVLSPTVSTTYTVTGKNLIGGCSQTKTITVATSGAITMTTTPALLKICRGDSILFAINGAQTVSWSNGATSYTTYAKPIVTKTFSVNASSSCNSFTSAPTVTVSMKGVYKIGGSSPDFTGLRSAINALAGGVCGPVIFDIRPGTYVDTLSIPLIPGTSAINTITFRSENGDSSSVILSDFATASSAVYHYVLGTKKPNFLIFSKLTFKQNVTSYSGSSANGPYLFYFDETATSGNAYVSVQNCRFIENNLTVSGIILNGLQNTQTGNISNCLFQNGKTGINVTNCMQYNITGNKCLSQTYTGITAFGFTGSIANNFIRSSSSTQVYGLNCMGTYTLSANQINVSHGGGIYAGYSKADIRNNFVFLNGATSGSAVNLEYTNAGTRIVFNTIRIAASTNVVNASDAFFFSNGSTSLNNNIVQNRGQGYIYKVSLTSTITATNNRFETVAPNFGYRNSSNYATFSAWKAAFSTEGNSQSAHTFFINDTTYKVSGDFMLNGSAIPVSGITNDIEGQPRNSTFPDIGAYEFNLQANDASVSSFLSLTDSVFCQGLLPVSVRLKNYGTDTLKSAKINWSLNGVNQPQYNWSGSIKSGDSTSVAIGSVILSGGRKNKFVVSSSMPNNNPDQSTNNDTLTLIPVKTRLSGTYTIGGSSPDYLYIKSAMDSLQRYGVCGPVIYNIRNGVYNSRVTLAGIAGSSAGNTVTLQSESQDSSLVVIADTGGYFGFSNTRNLVFNRLTFIQRSNLNYPTISASGSTSNLLIKNCVFDMSLGNMGISGNIRISPSDTTCRHFVVINCAFKNKTNIEFGSGATANVPRGAIVLNSKFENNGYIKVNGMDSVILSGNSLINTSSYPSVQISNTFRQMNIFNNLMYRADVSLTNLGANAFAKNFYNNILDSSVLQIINTPKVNVYHNLLSYRSDSSSLQAPIYFNGTVGQQKVRNNIIINRGGGPAVRIADMGFSGTVPLVFDHNDIVGKSSFTAYLVYSNVNVGLVAWQQSYNQDPASVTFMPSFAGAHDFHISNDHQLDNLGEANSIAINDRDNVLRNTITPDIGPYEFNGVQTANDAQAVSLFSVGYYCSGSSNSMYLKIKNNSSSQLNSLMVNWRVNGVSQTTYTWTGAVASGSTATLSIGSFIATGAQNLTIEANVSMPNGVPDTFAGNDTVALSGIYPKLNGIYTVGGTGCDFSSIDAVIAALNYRGICGQVTFRLKSGIFTTSNSTIDLGSINGNTVVNGITFESFTGNNSGTYIADSYINISSASNITFRNLTFLRSPVTLGSAINKLRFEGNVFDMDYLSSSSTPILTSNNYNYDVSFVNNTFKKAWRALNYTQTTGATYPKKLYIYGNTFIEQGTCAVYVPAIDSLIIDSNYVNKTSVSGSNTNAFRLNYPAAYFKISRNKIVSTYETIIQVIGKGGNHITKSSIDNNVIIGGTGAVLAGISNSCDSVLVAYNSLQVNGNYPGISINANYNKVYNNIVSAQTGKCLAIPGNTTTTSDYNVFKTTGTVLVSVGSSTYNTMASYTLATGKDMHSINVDPQYISITSDLHYQNHSLDGKATPLPDISYDQQNVLRDLITPNPGAYETPPTITYNTTNKYLVLKRIVTNTLTVGVNNTIVASISYSVPPGVDTTYYKYRGTIDSLRLHYKINGLPEIIETWNGALHLGDSLIYSFTTPYYVPNGKLYSVLIWYENLNPNQQEINLVDDSLRKQIAIPMSGDYTIGGSLPDFISYTDSWNSMYACGATSGLRFLFRPGNYGTFHYQGFNTVHVIPGLIEYRSESGHASDVSIDLVWLSSLDSMKFSNLTIHPVTGGSVSYGPFDGVQIGCVQRTIFDSCYFQGGATLAQQNGLHFFYEYSGVSATITNCTFRNMKFPVYLSSVDSYCSTSDTKGFVFENNQVDSCDYGLIAAAYDYLKWVSIRNNYIHANISGIKIGPINSGGVTYSGNFDISGNLINSSTALDITDRVSSMRMSNNMIISQNVNHLENVGRLKLYNNSFEKKVRILVLDSVELLNNSFYSPSNSEALYFSFSGSSYMRSDYNNIYAPLSINKAIYTHLDPSNPSNNLVVYPFTNVNSIKLQTGTDSNSVEFAPYYVSSNDLHSQSVNLQDMALPIPGITTDIDGESRTAGIPDIGADEIQQLPKNVWPGDANYDGIANNLDILELGLHFSIAGPLRGTISNSWGPFACHNWSDTLSNGNNVKHSDCNGDGAIDANDTAGVFLNYGLVHALKPLQASTSDTVLTIIPDQSFVNYGNWGTASVYMGSSFNPVNNVNGVAYTVTFDHTLIDPNNIYLEYPVSFLNTANQNLHFRKLDFSNDALYTATTHTMSNNVNGNGKIAILHYKIRNTASADTALNIGITAGYKSDASGLITPLTSGSSTVQVSSLTTEVMDISGANIYIYPTPANNYIIISGSQSLQKAELQNVAGLTIMSEAINGKQHTINLEQLASGIYFVSVYAGDRVVKRQKIVVQK